MDKTYGGAMVSFLDRDSQEVKTGYMYPITEVTLVSMSGGNKDKFVMESGEWVKEGGG